MAQPTSQDPQKQIRYGISAVESGDYALGLSLLSNAYANAKVSSPEGLSFYALALSLVEKKYRPAIDFCKKAIELQFYNPHHYVNLCKVYLAAGQRKKAYEALQQGLRVMPEEDSLLALQEYLGRRSEPPIPFLNRSNPLNQALGKARAAKKGKRKAK